MARGEWKPGFVPVQAAIDHISRLMACGMSQGRIGLAAGLDSSAVRQIHKGLYDTVRVTTLDRLLLVSERDAARPDQKNGYVPRIGSTRRLQALVAIGHSIETLSNRVGISDVSLRGIANGTVGAIRIDTAKRIAAVFDTLQLVTPAPSKSMTFSRNRAKKNGWHPPLAWDEDTIDDPSTRPLNPKRPKSEEWVDTYWELRDMGLVEERVAERLGISDEALATRLRRLEKKAA